MRYVGGSELSGFLPGNSQADFIAKMGIVEEFADESIYWMELLVESDILATSAVAELCDEGTRSWLLSFRP